MQRACGQSTEMYGRLICVLALFLICHFPLDICSQHLGLQQPWDVGVVARGGTMDLRQLHRHVRDAVRNGHVEHQATDVPLSAAERRALRAFDKRLKAVGGRTNSLVPSVAGSLEWFAPSAPAVVD